MFFPVRTDRRQRYTPWVNYALIAANVLAFVLTSESISTIFALMAQGMPLDQIEQSFSVAGYLLLPDDAKTHQFISYQFLHAGWQHLLGNMLFLYVFGNNVEDRLGKVGYLAFYLAGGVLAGLGHALVEPNPILGASGAVAAVSGAYLVWFPLSNVTIVYWFIFIGAFEISSLYLILFQMAQDAMMFVGHFGGVAYLAHLSGYAFGFGIAMALLGAGFMSREPCDLMALIEQRRRRAQFRALTQKGYQPWAGQVPTGSAKSDAGGQSDPHHDEIMHLRAAAGEAVRSQDMTTAAHKYVELLALDSSQVMGEPQQLEIANQLMSQQSYDHAARAYELFLDAYRNYTQREQVQLILALIYARYMGRQERARELLDVILPKLTDPAQQELAKQVLHEVSA